MEEKTNNKIEKLKQTNKQTATEQTKQNRI